jgi:hypothetical protein
VSHLPTSTSMGFSGGADFYYQNGMLYGYETTINDRIAICRYAGQNSVKFLAGSPLIVLI